MADKGGSINKQGRNMHREDGKFKKAGEQGHKEKKEKWPVDEIEEER